MTARLRLAAVWLSFAGASACTTSPGATAQRIASSELLIGGPKASGQIGDYYLGNDKIRAIIHDVGPGRGSLPYGGILIDADLVRTSSGAGQGNDQLGELTPAMFATLLAPERIEVINDGSDGQAAQVAVFGRGRELIEQTGLLMAGLLFPDPLEISQYYTLAPGDAFITIRTEVRNGGTGVHPLPFLSPDELVTSGLDIPNLPDLELSIPMGHLLGLGGAQSGFFAGVGFDSQFSLLEAYRNATGFPAFPGIVADFVASKGPGVSYGLATNAAPTNYAQHFAASYPGQVVPPDGLLVAFNFSSYLGLYSTNPPAQLAPGESFDYTNYFFVGHGDIAAISNQVYAQRGVATGMLRGVVLEDGSSEPRTPSLVIAQGQRIVTQVQPNELGAFSVNLPPGDYEVHVIDPLMPRVAVAVTVPPQGTSLRITVPPPATLAVTVRDENGRIAPAKITLVADFDAANAGQDPRTFLYSYPLGEDQRPTTLESGRREYVEMATAITGAATLRARPGRYRVWVSRGPEYDAAQFDWNPDAGTLTERDVQLARAFATPGWVAADTHVHSFYSVDGGAPAEAQVLAAAAEGLDITVATEHNRVISHAPAIWSLQLEDWITSFTGMELTTFEMGHFNAYPLRQDNAFTQGHDVSWKGQTPEQLFTILRQMGQLGDSPTDALVQVNHPNSGVLGYFSQFYVSPDTAAPRARTGLAAVFAPYSPEFAPEQFSTGFDALELLTGKQLAFVRNGRAPTPVPPGNYPDPQPVAGEVIRDSAGQVVYPGTVDIWFTMLNQGLRPTGVGSSDSHVPSDELGYARTWIYVGDEGQGQAISQPAVIDGLRRGRAIVSNGPFVQMQINGATIGDTIRASGNVTVALDVSSPSWLRASTLTLYANGTAVDTIAIPAGTRFRTDRTVAIATDTWLVAEVHGDASMFPVVTPAENINVTVEDLLPMLGSSFDLSGINPYGAIQPPKLHPVTPYAITNPIWIDADGGGFTARTLRHPIQRGTPTVRAQYFTATGEELAP